jgi:protein-tyrosine kinase
MASPTLPTLLDTIKREFRSRTVILDLPPMWAGDDVLSILPHLQSILLVAEAGCTSVSEIKECTKQLRSTPIVRLVVNKMTERESSAPYQEYY